MKRLPVELLIPIFIFSSALGGGCTSLKSCSRQFYAIYHAVGLELGEHTLRAYDSRLDAPIYFPVLRHLTIHLTAHWYANQSFTRESRRWRRSVGMEGMRIMNNNHTRLSDELFVDMLLLIEIVDRTPNLEYILFEVDTTMGKGVFRLLTIDRDYNAEVSNRMRAGGWSGRIEVTAECLRTV